MAIPGYITTQLAALGKDAQGPLSRVFEYVLSNLKAGATDSGKRAANFQWYRLDAVSPATPGETFSVEHGLPSAPYFVLPFLDGRVAGGSVAVRIAAPSDAKRVYLTCDDANALVSVYVEGA